MDRLTSESGGESSDEPAGDHYALVGQLFGEHRPGLLRLAVVLVGDQRTAEDVVQEAFIGLIRHWSQRRDPESAQAYVRSAVLKAPVGCYGAGPWRAGSGSATNPRSGRPSRRRCSGRTAAR